MNSEKLHRFLLSLSFIIVFSIIGSAQKKIDFDSKFLFTTEELGPDIKVLTDSVVFKHENSIMFCDSALFNYGQNYFDAYGNIIIKKVTKDKDTVYLYGDTLHYYGKKKYAKVRTNVILKKDSLILYTDSLDFDLRTNIGHYFENGLTLNGSDSIKSVFGYYYADENLLFYKKNVEVINPKFKMYCDTLKHNTKIEVSYFLGPTDIISEENHIHCENGWYDHQKNITQFSKNATLKNKEQLLMGDTIFYDKNKGVGKAFGHVIFKDSLQNVILRGNKSYYNEKTDFTLMTDRALFIQGGESNDSLYLHADTLQSYKDSIQEDDKFRVYSVIQAFRHVKTYKKDFQSKCDSLVYELKDSTISMYYEPVIWSDSNQLSADSIIIRTYEGEVDIIEMYERAFIISKSDSVHFDQIYGKEMYGYVDNRELYRIDVISEGKSVYFIRDDEEKLIGVNFLECTDMEIYMKDNKVDKVWFFEMPKGKIHPPLELTYDETKLPGFKWDIDYRPFSKDDLFVWKRESVPDTGISGESGDSENESGETEN
jgi:lipopolysaccharide export system protein LptA